MGLYPEVPGRTELVLGSPLFPAITIHRPVGDSPCVHQLLVSGQPSAKTSLPEALTLHGGTLNFTVFSIPDKIWGAYNRATNLRHFVPGRHARLIGVKQA